MDISEKIEEIRRQPEHMRIRYVWGCVAISMFIVLILWIFSIASMFAEEKNSSSQTATEIIPSMGEQLQTLKEQAPSLKNLNDQSLTIEDEDATATYQGLQYSTDDAETDNTSQANTYSNLQNTNSPQ